MALLYRAIWDEDRPALIDEAVAASLEWFRYKGLVLDTLPDGETSGEFHDSRMLPLFPTRFELSVTRAAVEEVRAMRVRLVENRDYEGQSWTTTFTVLAPVGPGGTLWVDVERVSDDPFRHVAFRAPQLVKNLIENGAQPRVGHVRLEARPCVIPVEGLAGLVLNLERRLPLVIFSHDRAGPQATIARARAAYDALAGVAQVFMLPPDDVDEFKSRVGEELAVWGGAARLYLPNWGPAGLHPRRHRYVSGAVAARGVHAAAERFAVILAGTVPATPAPAEYGVVRHQLRVGAQRDLQELLEIADEELGEKDKELEQLRAAYAALEGENLDLAVDYEDLAAQNNRLCAQIALVVSHAGGRAPEPTTVEIPDEVSTITDAVNIARSCLTHIAVHEDALVDIEKLEAAVTAGPWANLIWRGLRALDAYAASEGVVEGGFYEWCRGSGSAWAWPATDKKLALHESEGVMNNQRLRAARKLPVAREVAPDGRIEMFAHLKIAQGGGPLAPRVYFYDDTKGSTGKMHVGYIGPHEHMPNLSTN